MSVAVGDAGQLTRGDGRDRVLARALPHRAVLALAIVTTAWAVTFAVLVVRRHHGFWDVDFDMGIHDQSIWLLAHGRGFMTVRGLQVFGHHATPAYYLLVPFYWLGAGPDFLNVLQVVTLALGVVPLYLLARERHLNPWVAAILGAALLLHPATQFFSWELFHPEVMAITPLLCAYLCAERRSWGWFALWCGLALAWKEDVALVIVVLGLIVALRGNRRLGLITAGIALTWFLVWTIALFPAINGGHVQSEGLYQTVGGTPGGMISKLFTDPHAITSHVFSSESGDFVWRLLAPFGFIPLLGPLVLLIGLPQLFLDLVSDASFTRQITYHYAALPLTALLLGAFEALSFVRRRLGARAVAVGALVLLAGGLFGTIAWGLSPIGAKYHSGYWPPDVDTRIGAKRAAVAMIPGDAVVSAVYGFVPQLSHRPEIYSFPNPWISKNFGIDGKPRRSPRRVQWLVVDRTVIDPDPQVRALFDSIIASGKFKIVFDRQEIVVARRVHA